MIIGRKGQRPRKWNLFRRRVRPVGRSGREVVSWSPSLSGQLHPITRDANLELNRFRNRLRTSGIGTALLFRICRRAKHPPHRHGGSNASGYRGGIFRQTGSQVELAWPISPTPCNGRRRGMGTSEMTVSPEPRNIAWGVAENPG